MVEPLEANRKEFRKASFHTNPEANILLVSGQCDGYHKPIGSGIVIAPYLAVTAWHVLEEFYKTFHEGEIEFIGLRGVRGNIKLIGNPGFSVTASFVDYLSVEQRTMNFFVESICISPIADLVLMKLARNPDYPDFKFCYRPMRAVPPAEGTYVDLLGHRCEDEGRLESVHVVSYVSRGPIRKVFWKGGGNGLYYSPGFLVSAPLVGGMSGGPVYTLDGQLCGIVCADAGVDIDNPYAEDACYATMLFPLLACLVQLNDNDSSRKRICTIKELCKQGVISMRLQHRFEIICKQNGDLDKFTSLYFRDRPPL